MLAANLVGATWLLATSWTLDVLVRRQTIASIPNLRLRALCGAAGIVLACVIGVWQVLA